MKIGMLCAALLALSGCAHSLHYVWFNDPVEFTPATAAEFAGSYQVWLHVDFGGHNSIMISDDGTAVWDYQRIGDLVNERGELDYVTFLIHGKWEAVDTGHYRLRFIEEGPAHSRVFECRSVIIGGKRGLVVAAEGVALAERVEETEGFSEIFFKESENQANQSLEPTSAAVTPRAFARIAPAAPAAQL